MWEQIDGADLHQFHSNNELESVLPSTGGIYAWKLNTLGIALNPYNPAEIVRHMSRLMALPQGISPAQKILGSGIEISGVILRGGELSDDKHQALREWAAVVENAKWLIEYLKAVREFIPALYVGKADDVCVRARQHLNRGTTFARTMRDKTEIRWSDMTFHWLEIPSENKTLLETIEFSTQTLSISAFTKRRG